jgi:hypothetical protein
LAEDYGKRVYKGISYSITKLRAHHWEWHVQPPQMVKGLYPSNGTLNGPLDRAVNAAKAEIDRQTAPLDPQLPSIISTTS